MKILDNKGRLFGKLSLLDLGAGLIVLAVIFGIFIFPGTSGSIAQGSSVKPVEIDMIVRGLSVGDPEALIAELEDTQKTDLIIRNESHGEVAIKAIDPLKRLVVVPQPDGTAKALPDPRPSEETFSTDMIITLADEAQVNEEGIVLGGQKIKIGTLLELEGKTYNFKGSVMGVRILD
ncbi:DUF4330 domain-containing protein [Lusitaniella coriacea LEGE 07157]|uniref:DUF4330 domain-containing protein n=1 Tax=Lusitaniella coriacea LEGE 07157 TaxID=945747 RepID=A0A8J7J2Y9_9CYAN|nr:DUF4330 domain-containing protein [Lusitaniella coriacea]MBE9116659.1 DUF4330 domain-containing protein [Lusitaniella coriacea LEGE 07157]